MVAVAIKGLVQVDVVGPRPLQVTQHRSAQAALSQGDVGGGQAVVTAGSGTR